MLTECPCRYCTECRHFPLFTSVSIWFWIFPNNSRFLKSLAKTPEILLKILQLLTFNAHFTELQYNFWRTLNYRHLCMENANLLKILATLCDICRNHLPNFESLQNCGKYCFIQKLFFAVSLNSNFSSLFKNNFVTVSRPLVRVQDELFAGGELEARLRGPASRPRGSLRPGLLRRPLGESGIRKNLSFPFCCRLGMRP